jgi:hypothetical protein
MSVYRPTVRYAPVFRDYVDDVFNATHLDRNQIIRLALFVATHTKEFRDVLMDYKKKDVLLPSPSWRLSDHHYWLEQCPVIEREGRDANAIATRGTSAQVASPIHEARSVLSPSETGHITPVERFTGQIPSQRSQSDGRIQIRGKGRITFTVE